MRTQLVEGNKYAINEEGVVKELGTYIGKKGTLFPKYLFCTDDKESARAGIERVSSYGIAFARDGQNLNSCSLHKSDLKNIHPYTPPQQSVWETIFSGKVERGGKKRRSTKKRKSKRSHKRGRHTKRIR